MIGIYKITSPTGRVYVGQSIEIEKRFSFYKSVACKSQVKLYRSLKKYGFDNHVFEVLEECSIEDLFRLERHYQEKFNTITDGLNCIYVATSEKKAIRSIETRKKIGDFNRGKKRSKEICEKISKARKGMVFTDEHKENIRKSKTGENNARSKKVIDTKTGEIYPSVAAASKVKKIDHRTLSKYLIGTRTNKTNLKFL